MTATIAIPARAGAERVVEPTPARGVRLVVGGVGDARTGARVAAWLAATSLPGDQVHLVHVYEPMRLDGCTWQPVHEAQHLRVAEARRLAALAEAPVRAARTGADVSGSAIAAEPVAALVELSKVADLLVLGSGPTALRVAARADCPVVVVTRDEIRNTAPVTVLASTPALPRRALDFAVQEADRRSTTLRAVQLRTALRHPEASPAELVADDQVALDTGLVMWRASAPHLGIVAEISFAPVPEAVHAALTSSGLVVLPAADVDLLTDADVESGCAVALVPGR